MPSEEQINQIADNVALVVKRGLSNPHKCYDDVIADVREAVLQEISTLYGPPTTIMSFLRGAADRNAVLHEV
jgi:hypothetical protein